MIKRLFWDIETSPCVSYLWRTGWKLNVGHHMIIKEAAIICISFKWGHEDEVHTLRWDDGSDKDLLRQFLPIAREADELVAHNGDRFDIKWFNTRCLAHGLSGSGDWKTRDTFKIAKAKFSFNSNSLQYISKRLIGDSKFDHAGFSMWKDIIERQCPIAMDMMVEYCEKDVRLLEQVFYKLEPYAKPASNAAVMDGQPRWACQYCGSRDVTKSKTRTTAAGTRQHQMVCKDHGDQFRYYQISNLAYNEYRQDRFDRSES